MIVIDNLVKTYKGVEAVKGVSFKVDEGSITGFIGRNGAGKSTTLRGILGLCHMDQGQASIFEQDYKSLHNPSLSIGVVLDASKLHPSRTGYDTLLIAASINSTSKERIWEILGKCGLNKKQSKRLVKTYSLGMKQRLCIGMALLASPSVLVLDEPMNGLDPEGMMWIRKIGRAHV